MSNISPYDKIALLRLAFKGLQVEELQEMAALTRICTYLPDHILCREGAYEEIFYIVADGSLIITKKISELEGERTLRVVGRGDIIGEMALVQNAPRSATVRTTSTCSVLEMSKTDFETVLSRSPRMAINIMRTTLDRMRENDQTAIQELQKTNKLLRQLDRNKLDFIQIAAHELRTPLTVLKGYVSVLRSFPILKGNPALTEVLEGIGKGADRMHEVVNMMLDVERIDSESLKIRTAQVLVKQMINDSVRSFAKAAEERRLEIRVTHHSGVTLIHADPALMQKALDHLLVNAIKYTPDGGKITITTRPMRMENNEPGIEIAVQDTGIGLDAEQQTLIFEKFYQVGTVALHSSGKTSFKGGGPGLGLAIVRGVVRAHGGKVWVESTGHDEVNYPGSTFYVHLPVLLSPP